MSESCPRCESTHLTEEELENMYKRRVKQNVLFDAINETNENM